jgi:ribonuclease P protein component
MRFRPDQHLRRQSDFRAVREHGRRINCGAFIVSWLRREPALGDSIKVVPTKAGVKRLGVVASTASVGHAVLRNRAKRRLREIFRRNQDLVPGGCDMLLTARTAATIWPIAELETKFVEACRQIAPPKNG